MRYRGTTDKDRRRTEGLRFRKKRTGEERGKKREEQERKGEETRGKKKMKEIKPIPGQEHPKTSEKKRRIQGCRSGTAAFCTPSYGSSCSCSCPVGPVKTPRLRDRIQNPSSILLTSPPSQQPWAWKTTSQHPPPSQTRHGTCPKRARSPP